MIDKPSSCMGCPFYHKGQYFTPDTITPGSKVMFIAQNPGPDEEAGHKLIKRTWHYGQSHDEYEQVIPQPLIGATGQLLNKRFLPLAGLSRSQVSVGNAIRCRPGHDLGLKSNGLPTITSKMKLESSQSDIVKAIKHCHDAHLHIPSSIKVIVAMGDYSLFQLTGIHGVINWRGYGFNSNNSKHSTINSSMYHPLDSDKLIFITMHLAALYQGENKKYLHATLQDFHKLGRLLRSEWPLPLPTWQTSPPTAWPKVSAFDTEYIVDTNELIRWSLCDIGYNLYCVESNNTDNKHIPIQPHSTVIIQNALADIAHLSTIVDISLVNIEDMMLADSVLWTGEPHSLNYIASKHGAFNRYKHLIAEEGQEQLYSSLDAYEPMYIWRNHFIPQFIDDKQSWQVYKKYRLPLINIIDKAQRAGVKVNTTRLQEVQQYLQQRIDEIREEARVITGDDTFNIGGSKRMKEEIYG